jgi:hypothetical protein
VNLPAGLTLKQTAFLVAYAELGTIRHASEAADCSRGMHSAWLREQPVYAAAFEGAQAAYVELLEAEVHRRAVEGVEEPVGWYKGVAGGKIRRYSDNLLMFKLKAVAPDRYRDRVEVSTPLRGLDLNRLPEALLARLAAGEHPASVLASGAEEVRGLLLAAGIELGGPGTPVAGPPDADQDEAGQAAPADPEEGDL